MTKLVIFISELPNFSSKEVKQVWLLNKIIGGVKALAGFFITVFTTVLDLVVGVAALPFIGPILIFLNISGYFLILFIIFSSLQEITIAPYPRECLCATLRTAGNQLCWYSGSLSHRLYHFFHWLYCIPRLVMTAIGALEKPVISLNLTDLFLFINFDELCVLIGGQYMKILALKDFI